jgi:hypothetical protein
VLDGYFGHFPDFCSIPEKEGGTLDKAIMDGLLLTSFGND